jgi:hypothetical protein
MINVKSAFAVLAVVTLSACNMVVSDKPWFDAASGPQLKDGLWANLDSPGCAVDPAKTIAQWPECAQPMLIRGNTYSGPPAGSDPAMAAARFDPSKWQAISHFLVEGEPQVDQIFLDLSKASANDGIDRSKAKSFYLYVAVKPIARDADGRITATLRWPVMCGPLPKNTKSKDGKPIFVTDQPFAGLTLDDGRCTAQDPAALRGAAAQSEGVAQASGFAIITSRWISDEVK